MKKKYPSQRACTLLSTLITHANMYSLLLAGLLVMCQTPVAAKDSISEIRISLHAQQESVKEILQEIEKQSGLTFVYLTDQVDEDRKLTLHLRKVAMNKVLEKMFVGTSVRYEQKGNKILLKKMVSEHQPLAKYETMVSGKITDETGQPLPGVNILVKGTTIGTTSDNEGNYTIRVPDPETILVFSFIGYSPQEIKVGGQSQINVSLLPDIQSLQEVVVVGYGTQKKVNVTGSVSSVTSKELENRPITQSSQALAGLAAGVSVAQGSGRPGNDGAAITIRGLGTFSGAGTSPLILIDGLASSINEVDPNNIKSISVLKDAASASIYGTRAANGVILIETKRGQEGKITVNYNNYIGWQKVTKLPDFVDSYEFATLRNEANANMGQGPTYTSEEIAKFRSGEDPDNYPNVPHLKNLLTSGSGFQTYHNVSLAGGDGKNSYLFSLGYLNQNGIVRKNDYDKYNFLLNFDSKIKDNLKLAVNLSGNTANTDEPRQYDGDMMSMIGFAVREGPIYAGKKSDGTYGYQDNFSPEAWLDSKSFVNRKNNYFLGGTQLSWEIIKGLTLSGRVGYNYTSYTDNSYASTFTFNQFKTVGPNNLTVNNGESRLLTLQTLAQYSKQIDEHNFTILAGFSQEEFRQDWMTAYRDKFPNDDLHELNAGASSNMQSSGSASEWGLRSYFGRINYAYNEKYLLEANARYDGTSRFPKNGRWGLFPSFSVGWRISEELFAQDISWLDNLKVRASWGQLGNQNIGEYPYQSRFALGQNYTFGGTLASGARITTLANPDITWETTQITDIGLDADLFGGRLGVVLDYFSKTTSDILYTISVSRVLGFNTSEVNAGEVKNKGFEILLNYRTEINNLKIGISPNFSYVKNEVTKLSGGIQNDIGRGLYVGKSLNAIYGYVADGLFVDSDDVASYPTQPYAAEPGLVRFKDISGPNGVPDGKVDATYDRTVIGSAMPKYSFGATINLEYKGFDLSVLLHGLGGFEKQMGSYQAFAFYNGGQIQRWQADGRWTESNPDRDAVYPKLTSLNMGSGAIQTSTFWNRNATFLRLKNLQIGYTIPTAVIEKLHLTRLRIFASGQNLFAISKFYQGWDPEMSQNTGDNSPFYPITSVYTFGVNVKF